MIARTENYGHGWRVLLDLGGEEWVFRIERAIELRDALTAAIDEAAAKSCFEQAEEKSRMKVPLEPECPGPDCPMCSGEMCNLCGAGCWNNAAGNCEHATDERHEDPQPTRTP